MSANPKFITLLRNLLEATERGNLDWEDTPADNTYRVFLDRAFVHISRNLHDIPDQVWYVASLVSTDGKEVAELISTFNDNNDELKLLANLYDAARRRAINVDGFLDGLIETVKQKR